MANSGHNACDCKDARPQEASFTVTRGDIFLAENAPKFIWRPGSDRSLWGAYSAPADL